MNNNTKQSEAIASLRGEFKKWTSISCLEPLAQSRLEVIGEGNVQDKRYKV